jgi:hypothetical protein
MPFCIFGAKTKRHREGKILAIRGTIDFATCKSVRWVFFHFSINTRKKIII